MAADEATFSDSVRADMRMAIVRAALETAKERPDPSLPKARTAFLAGGSATSPRASAATTGQPRASNSSAVQLTTGTLRMAPAEERMAFGPNGSAQPGRR